LQNNIKFLGTDFSKLSNNRFQGWGVGAGVAYGYAMILGKHWNLEFEVGVGYIYSAYDIFECTGCGRRVGQDNNHYVGLTKAAINLVYLF
jgi:putative salt-induced outer membrane protein YdiY